MSTPGLKKNILIADDSKSVRSNIFLVLTGAGYNVLEAKNGLEALKVIKTQKVDLILLDIQMPQMNGYELLRMVKNDIEVKGTPILCVTNVHTKVEDAKKMMDLGAAGYIKKDGTNEDLLFRIERALTKK